MKHKSKQTTKKQGIRKDQLRIVSGDIDKMQDEMQKALIDGEEGAKDTVVKLIRSRRETRVNFTFKGNPETTEKRLQKVYKSITS